MYIDSDFEWNYVWYPVLVKNSLEIVSTAITTARATTYMKTTQTTKTSFLAAAMIVVAIESLNVITCQDYDTFVEAIVVKHNIEIYEAPKFDFRAESVEMAEASEGWYHFPEEMN